jgi:hypothetical protein
MKITKILLFTILVCLAFYKFCDVFKLKTWDSVLGTHAFYAQADNTIDVLVLGSSHAWVNIYSSILFEEYGMAAYVWGGSEQPMWNSYYNLIEALKSHNPQLVILEAYTVFNGNYQDEQRIILNNFGYEPSKNTLDALRESVPAAKLTEFLIRPYQYHNRYENLGKYDFGEHYAKIYRYYKGSGWLENMYKIYTAETPDMSGVTKGIPLPEKAERYYRMIIELCAEKQIPLEIVAAPFVLSNDVQARFITAEQIAGEYGVPFTNFNLRYDELGLDFTSDMADVGHLNYKGAGKLTRALGNMIQAKYSLPDRRVDARYLTWTLNAQMIKQLAENQILRETMDIAEYMDVIGRNSSYTIIATISGINPRSFQLASELFGVSSAYNPHAVFIIKNGKEQPYFDRETHPYFQINPKSFCFDLSKPGDIVLDGTSKLSVSNGINIIVYDGITDTIADSVGLDAANDMSMVRK